ncbi:MAG: hypothetical protein ACKVJG_21035 [Candidatus Latescibacterota bacterium]|jgi:hypothetical protein
MTRAQKKPSVSLSSGRGVVWVGLLVVATLFHVWQKVEIAHVERQLSAAELRLRELDRERTNIMSGIAFKKNFGQIEDVAIERIGMVHAHSGNAVAGSWAGRELD